MKRSLLNLLAALSLLPCAWTVVASVTAMRAGGQSLSGYDVFEPLGPPHRFGWAETPAYPPPPPAFNFAGFRVQRGYRAEYTIQPGRVYTVPFWFMALVFGVAPGLWLRVRWQEWRRARRHRRWEGGVCPECGYDLRATPGRCPECGMEGTGGPLPA